MYVNHLCGKWKIGLFEGFISLSLNMLKQPTLSRNSEILLFFTEICHFYIATHTFWLFESKIESFRLILAKFWKDAKVMFHQLCHKNSFPGGGHSYIVDFFSRSRLCSNIWPYGLLVISEYRLHIVFAPLISGYLIYLCTKTAQCSLYQVFLSWYRCKRIVSKGMQKGL